PVAWPALRASGRSPGRHRQAARHGMIRARTWPRSPDGGLGPRVVLTGGFADHEADGCKSNAHAGAKLSTTLVSAGSAVSGRRPIGQLAAGEMLRSSRGGEVSWRAAWATSWIAPPGCTRSSVRRRAVRG